MTRFNPQAKLTLHPQFARFVAGDKVAPINVEVSICHVCQAKCSWCFYSGTHMKLTPESTMCPQVATQLLEDMHAMGCKAVTWTGGGEPTLHPHFPTMVDKAERCELEQGLFTNALSPPKYDASKLQWIRVSNTDKDWPLENLKRLREKAKTLGMMLNYTGEDAAVHRALEVGREVGVNYVQIRPALNLRGLVTERPVPKVEDPLLIITEYKFSACGNPHGYDQCFGFNFAPFIWHDGDVDVCGYHRKKGEAYTLGNLHKDNFINIMQRAPRSVPVIPTCQVCCKNHEANRAVNTALEVTDTHFV